MSEDLGGQGQETEAVLVPVIAGGQTVYLSVTEIAGRVPGPGEEGEISSRGRPSLGQALDGLTGVATELAAKLEGLKASRLTVEFGCEFALESGAFVAVVGKATARSAFKVGLEWTKST